MKLQDYFDCYERVYAKFIAIASEYGRVNEEEFSMYARGDYGDIAFGITIESPSGDILRYRCPITYDWRLDLDEQELYNKTKRRYED